MGQMRPSREAASVRIRRPKVCKLACKTQGERIFAEGEYPATGERFLPAHLFFRWGSFSDSKVFRIFIDAFRAFSVCRQFGPAKLLTYLQICSTIMEK
jgi:hypothetical protein